ncbi:uncharacterized protein PHACADRAFT_256446 [Phanerochaete carnosa HHB-10118-sp]|uniref:RlpA-like protein double-psi beta-barrel domain-containing protein n=1 Tax=Phanerochaete carnosa (strain HHB-10118-sp) TaxID=650164 RepID=K5W9L5_PHACS|nr:uncharacterized protein PHACADRAFT_256446 [Phanerochaete carnosa HHB-10118-sp]EKM55664.1 hypothetical protein PHACADRAFT_256446 [Phanerochaete carnosa HHB-10118-sp]
MVAFASLSFLSALVLSLSLFTAAAVGSHETPRRRHPGTNFLGQNHTLSKRFDDARFSYYEAGQGACGATNSDSDSIVALNSAQFAGGSNCFQMITISYNGKSTQAQITDECPGCPYGGLDLTPGLFSFFASEDAGIIYGTWNFGSGAAPSPSPSPTPAPTPTPTPTPTSVWTPPVIVVTTSSSTSSPPPPPPTTSSSTEAQKSSSATSSTPTPSTSSTSSASSAPPSSSSSAASSMASSTSSAVAAAPSGNINQLNSVILRLAALAAAAEQSQ